MNHPLNYSDFIDNEVEFDDSNSVRKISFYKKRPIKSNLKFDNFLINIMKKDDLPSLKSSPDQLYYNFLNFKESKKQKFNPIFNVKVDWDQELSDIKDNNKINCGIENIKKAVPKNEITGKDKDKFTITEKEVAVRKIWNVTNTAGAMKSFLPYPPPFYRSLPGRALWAGALPGGAFCRAFSAPGPAGGAPRRA